MKRWQVGIAFIGLALSCLFASNSALAADWALEVVSIEVDGAKVAQVALQVTAPQSANSAITTIRQGDRFGPGAVIAVPARTTLMLRSSNANTLRLLPSSRIRILAGSDMGEEFGLESGQSFFDVKHALNFFNVRHGRFQAIVKGTRYGVKVVPEKEIAFDVEVGTVRIEHGGKIKIDEGNKGGTVTVSETLSAGQSKSYRLDIDEYLARFKHFGEAEAYYRKNLETDRQSGDPDRIEAGLNQMGIVLCTLGKYREAIPFFDEYRQSAIKRHPGGVHADIAGSLAELGIAYSGLGGTGNLQRAIGYQAESLKIYRRLYPSGVHADIAGSLAELGIAYSSLGGTGNLQRAIAYQEESLTIYRQLYPGGVQPDIAGSLAELGIAYSDLGGTANLQRAIGYHEESLKIYRQLYPGGVHPSIAGSLAELGIAYSSLGGTANLQRAIGYQEESLKIDRQLYPSGVHADIVRDLGALSFSRLLAGQFTESLQDAREALQIAPTELWIRVNEAHALLLMGREAEALAIYTRYRDQPIDATQTFREAALADFAALRKAGVDRPGMAKIEALYGEAVTVPARAKP